MVLEKPKYLESTDSSKNLVDLLHEKHFPVILLVLSEFAIIL